MRRRWRLGWLGLVILGCSPKAGTEAATPGEPAVTTPAPVAKAESEAEPFHRQFGPEHENLVYVSDLLPWAEAYAAWARYDPATATQPKAWWQVEEEDARSGLGQYGMYVPREIAVGVTAGGEAVLDRIVRGGLAWGLCVGAIAAGEQSGAEELPRAQAELAAQLEQLELEGLTIWVHGRDATLADLSMGFLQNALQQVEDGEFVTTEALPNGVAVTVQLPQSTTTEQVALGLATAGIARTPNDPGALAIARALLDLRFRATVTRHHDALRIDLGSAPEPGSLDASTLHRLGLDMSPPPLAGGVWDARRLRAASREWKAMVEQWQETPAWAAMREKDDEDLLGDLQRLIRELGEFPESGESTVAIDDGVLRVQSTTRGGRPAVPLRDHAVLSFLPAGSGSFGASGGTDLAQGLISIFETFEERMGRESLKEIIQDDPQEVSWEAISQLYYRAFGPTRALVFERAPAVFEPPVLWVLGDDGIVPGLAVIGKIEEGADAQAFVAELYGNAVENARAAAGEQKKRSRSKRKGNHVRKRDLGLGRDTWVFEASWADELLAKLKSNPEAEAALADVVPHFFSVDEYFVLSTSPALSRRVLEQRRSGRPGLPIGEPTITAHGQLSMALFVGVLQRLATAAPSNDDDKLRKFATETAVLLQHLGDAQWSTTSQGTEHRSEYVQPLHAARP